MIIIRNIRCEHKATREEQLRLICRALRISENSVKSFKTVKFSLDARKKNDIHYVYSFTAELNGNEAEILRRARNDNAAHYEEYVYEIPRVTSETRPVIVGFGPAGMFAALVLSRAGLRPIILERGQDAITRKKAVDTLRAGGKLDPECNVQFGEGGAGTFSDGKLNTGTHDRRMQWMLNEFYRHGAPESVTYDAKPHIGTDILIDVVQSIRREVIANGGEVRFGHKLKRLNIDEGVLTGAQVVSADGEYTLDCTHLILAIGHSARDTFTMLHELGVPMERKPFSMGVRIEHKQSDIDLAQYGRERGEYPAADYTLNVHLPDGTSAYTFCMCPGGEVFAAASEEGGVCTNGMSYSARDGENANAALLVTLRPEDFPGVGVLAGMYWQREIERAAYEYGGENYLAPAQLVGDFLENRPSTGARSVEPTYKPGVIWGSIRDVLPPRITQVIKNALPELGKKLKGFDSPDAVMTAPETRSSSPVRILRNDDRVSTVKGLYPCGEGAGYAGGITSAAIDGMKCAEAVINSLLQI